MGSTSDVSLGPLFSMNLMHELCLWQFPNVLKSLFYALPEQCPQKKLLSGSLLQVQILSSNCFTISLRHCGVHGAINCAVKIMFVDEFGNIQARLQRFSSQNFINSPCSFRRKVHFVGICQLPSEKLSYLPCILLLFCREYLENVIL